MKYHLFGICLGLFALPANAIKRYSLEEIQANPKFDVSIKANGQFSGKSIELQIKSNFKKSVEVLIPAGTVFYTPEEDDQILILVEEELLVLSKGNTRKKVLDGFCTEAKDGVPRDELSMAFMPTEREQLQKLADFINEHHGFDKHAIQEAVWCVSDKYSVANIYSPDKKKTKELAQFVADLTGQTLSWHNVRRDHRIVGERIVVNPVMVVGEVTFTTTRETTLKTKIVNESGETVYEKTNSRKLPKVENITMEFSWSVSGWEAGKYNVIYFDEDGKTIFEKAFEI